MDQSTLLQRRARIHGIVEGALLGDIAIVFLLMRVYLPVPIVRTLLRVVASVPFVMLTQRRGFKITMLAAVASYILFSALVGPLLALTAIDIAVAGILVGLGRKVGIGPGLNTLWTGVAYTVLDLVIPTIATVILFRYPVQKLIDSARHFVRLIFQFGLFVMDRLHFPAAAIHQVKAWEAPTVSHWQLVWLGTMLVYGLLNMYLTVLMSEMVLRQIPDETLAAQKAA